MQGSHPTSLDIISLSLFLWTWFLDPPMPKSINADSLAYMQFHTQASIQKPNLGGKLYRALIIPNMLQHIRNKHKETINMSKTPFYDKGKKTM